MKADGTQPPAAAASVAAPHRLSLAANVRWALAGNVVYALTQWAMLSVLARWASEVAVGQFVLGLAIAAPVTALAMLQLRNVQVTDVRRMYSFADYFGTRILWSIVGMVIIVAWAALAGDDRTTFWVIIIVGLMKSVDSVSDIVRGYFQSRERMDLNGISLMTKGIISLAAMAATIKLTGSIVAATGAAALAWAVAFVGYDMVLGRRLILNSEGSTRGFRPVFRLKAVTSLTWISLPLGAVMAIISLQTNIPRYVLEHHSGKELLGYFGAIVYPMMAGMMLTTAMGQAASPRLARSFIDDVSAFVRLLIRMSLISAGVGLAILLFVHFWGDLALRILYGPSYASFHREFEVLAVAWGIQMVASCLGYGLTAAKCFRVQVVLTVLSCAATTAAAILLIPTHGIMGASLAVLITSLSMMLGCMIVMTWVVRKALHSQARPA